MQSEDKYSRRSNSTKRINKKLCALLRNYRKFCGLTQGQVAIALGVDRSTYTYYETGKTSPNINTLMSLVKILNIPYEEFLKCVNSSEMPETATSLNDYIRDINDDLHSLERESVYELADDEQQLLVSYRVLSSNEKLELLKRLENKMREQNGPKNK